MPVDMAGITTFEELERWQRARELTRLIYRVSGDGDFGRDFALRDQIRRAAISVLSNIAEGFERGGNRELIQFLSLAKGSIGEVRARSMSHWTLDTSRSRHSMSFMNPPLAPAKFLPA